MNKRKYWLEKVELVNKTDEGLLGLSTPGSVTHARKQFGGFGGF
jgi:hypothetical protein